MKDSKKTNEIDIIGVVKLLLLKWKYILKVIAIFAVIGIIVALNTQKEYSTEVILAPELSSGGMGLSESLSDMASTFGIDLGNKGQLDALYPEIYPDIFASTDFIISLFNIPIRQEKDSIDKSYHDHLLTDGKVPFWKYPIVLFQNLLKKKETNTSEFDPFKLSRNDELLCGAIRGAISCQIDKKTNIITIRVTDIDRQVSAIMADTLLHRLQNYITHYRTSKARNDLDYYEHLRDISKEDYKKIQLEYASYSDSHLNTTLQSVRLKAEELENEMQLKYQAYAQMEQQVRTAQARVQERTPAFTVIQNASIPNKASSTPRFVIVILYMFLGALAAGFWLVFGKSIYEIWRAQQKNKQAE